MSEFSEDQISIYEEVFCLFTKSGENTINVSSFGKVLRALGQNPTEAEILKCTAEFNPDDSITFEVFLPIFRAVSKNSRDDQAEDFIECLRHFDHDSSGHISVAEMRQILTSYGEKLSSDEVEQLLSGQEDSQGNINYEEFVHKIIGN